MASSGNVYTSKYGPRGLHLSWTASQDIGSNSSTISWDLEAYGDSPGKWYTSSNFSVTINGERVYHSDKKIDLYGSTHIDSGTHTVYHRDDGTMDISIEVSGGIYAWSITNVSGEDSWSLDTIPRKATIVSAPNFTDADSPTVVYSNLAGNAVSSLQIGILTPDLSSQDGYAIVPYREVSKTATEYTFQFTESERTSIYNYCLTVSSAEVAFVVRTVISGQTYWSTLIREVSIVNANPVIQPVIEDSNDISVSVTGDPKKLIAHISNAKYNAYVSAAKGATITSITVECAGTTLRTETGVFNGVTSGHFVFKAIDSRGYETTKVVDVPIAEYETPTINIVQHDLSPDGKLTVGVSGRFYKSNYGSKANKAKVELRYDAIGGTSSGWVDISSSVTDGQYPNTYLCVHQVQGLQYNLNYNVQARITDLFSSDQTPTTQIFTVPLYGVGDRILSVFAPYFTGPFMSFSAVPDALCLQKYADLNDYREPGTFAVHENTIAATLQNCPSSSAGKLFVMSAEGSVVTGSTWSYLLQLYLPYHGDALYIRSAHTEREPGNWTWSKWKSVTFT